MLKKSKKPKTMKEKMETLTAFLEKYGYENFYAATADGSGTYCVGYATKEAAYLFRDQKFTLNENCAIMCKVDGVTVYLYLKP